MPRAAVLLAIVVAGLAVAPGAGAQIGPRVPAPLTEPPPPPPVQIEEDRGLATWQKLLIFGGALLVLGGIAFAIVRDARRAAPVDERPRHGGGGAAAATAGGRASAARAARERERQQRAKRAKAKAAKRQRRRNRPH